MNASGSAVLIARASGSWDQRFGGLEPLLWGLIVVGGVGACAARTGNMRYQESIVFGRQKRIKFLALR